MLIENSGLCEQAKSWSMNLLPSKAAGSVLKIILHGSAADEQ
jgi:hypothetical protein